jgi:hypothetical protein
MYDVQMNGLVDAVIGDVQIDGQPQICHAGEAVAPDALVGDVTDEAFNHVQPRRAGRSEMHDEAAGCRASHF